VNPKTLEEAFSYSLDILKCLQHVRSAVPDLETAPALFQAVENLASHPEDRAYLSDVIRAERGFLNLILLAEKVSGSDKLGGLEPSYRAQLDLERLERAAFEAQKPSEEGKRLLERTQAIAGKDFPLPLDGKLALLHCLQDAEFTANYSE